MRILLACEFYFPSVGGVQEVMRQLAERLVERGHRVSVVTTFLRERKKRVLNGVEIVEFHVAGNNVNGLIGEVERYREYLLDAEYDVVMIKAAQQWTFDALWPVLDGISQPKVLIPCGFSCLYEPEYAEYFGELPAVLHKFDQLIFYASDYRDVNYARAHGISKITIVPNGASEREFDTAIDSNFRRRHGIPEQAFVVLTVGSLTGLKGHEELVEAFPLASFANQPAVLVLNGNVPRPVSLRRRIAAVGLLRYLKGRLKSLMIRIHLGWLLRELGYKYTMEPSLNERLIERIERINRTNDHKRAMLVNLTRAELVQAYLNSDLFVLASNIEYSPLVLYEAAAAGLPFLSVPVGNAEEIAHWTGGGTICPAPKDEAGYTRADPMILADHITRLSNNPEELTRLGANGYRSWKTSFTWDKITSQYEEIFFDCIRRREP